MILRPIATLFLAATCIVGSPGCTTIRMNFVTGLMLAYGDLEEERYDAALARLDKLDAKEKRVEVLSESAYLRAQILEAQGRLPEAIRQYQHVIEIYPKSADGYLAGRQLRELAANPAPAEPAGAPRGP